MTSRPGRASDAPMAAGRRERSRGTAARTREAILDGAFEALMGEGLPNLSFDRVARASGTSRQLVRYHFPDGDALMIALCDRLAAAYRDALLEGVAARPPGRPRLTVFLDFYFDLLDGRPKPRDDRVYDAMMARAAGSERIRGRLREQYALLGRVLTHELAIAHPGLSGDDAAEIAWLSVALMYGHWRMVASLGFSEAHRRITRRAIDRLVKSYLAEPSERPPLPAWAVGP